MFSPVENNDALKSYLVFFKDLTTLYFGTDIAFLIYYGTPPALVVLFIAFILQAVFLGFPANSAQPSLLGMFFVYLTRKQFEAAESAERKRKEDAVPTNGTQPSSTPTFFAKAVKWIRDEWKEAKEFRERTRGEKEAHFKALAEAEKEREARLDAEIERLRTNPDIRIKVDISLKPMVLHTGVFDQHDHPCYHSYCFVEFSDDAAAILQLNGKDDAVVCIVPADNTYFAMHMPHLDRKDEVVKLGGIGRQKRTFGFSAYFKSPAEAQKWEKHLKEHVLPGIKGFTQFHAKGQEGITTSFEL